MCDGKKSKFIKKQEASVLSNSLGVRTSRGQIPLVDPFFFQGINKLIQGTK